MTEKEKPELGALRVQNAYKTYDGRKYVLRGLNMNVNKGTIYGLLGPSGCGKSTLLNAIVGLVTLESGEIQTLMNNRKDLGFMPQNISLYNKMTTTETLVYFGRICGMTDAEIEERSAYLIDFLEIPNNSSKNEKFSGGQRRRLSLAVALLHNPALIILDEPTVGVDPLLRKSIWDHLMYLTEKENKTVVITTHYIEETSQAHRLGLMRSGVLISEDTPTKLMSMNESGSLEETFVRLSRLQENQKIADDEGEPQINKRNFKKSTNRRIAMNSGPFFCPMRFKAELVKNFMSLKRDFGVTMFTVLIPIVALLSCHFAVGSKPIPFRLGIINDEFSSGVEACLRSTRNESCEFSKLSCLYLQKLVDKQITPIDVANMEDGIDLVRRSHIWGVIRFPSNYSNTLEKRADVPFLSSGSGNDQIIEDSMVEIYMDQSNMLIFTVLKQDLYDSLKETITDVYNECEWDPRSFQLPVKFEPFYFKLTMDPRHSVIPALLNILMVLMPMFYGVMVILEQRIDGATSRSVISGVTPFEFFASHFVVQSFVHTLQMTSASFLTFVLLDYHLRNPAVGLSVIYLQGFPGIAISLLLPLIVDTLFPAFSVCTGFCLASITTAGAVWPTEAIHPLIKPLTWALPTYFTTEALRNASLKGWGLESPSIWYGYVAIVVWMIVTLLAVSAMISIKKNRVFLLNSAAP